MGVTEGMGGAAMGAAVVCAGVAAWLMGDRRSGARRARLLLAGGAALDSGHSAHSGPPRWPRPAGGLRRVRGRPRAEWWAMAVGAVLAVLGSSVLPVVAGAAAVPLLRRVQLAGETRRARERRTDEVIALCGALAGEVRAGRQPGQALLRAARDTGGLGDGRAAVLAAARFGGDVPGALAVAARQPGADGLLGLAACWRVAVDRGAGLAAGIDRLEGALRAERDQRAELRAQLAGTRSTAVMLAALPGLGLLLGAALGADPLHVLLHTGAGLGCLLIGGVLEGAGLWWARRIVKGAEST
ncbi:type II secretion system F family protein [Streptomyces cadmiisoli]